MSVNPTERRARVFVVEDEALIAMELEDRLTGLGYVVAGTASRGEKALELIPASAPDVVLMDIRLAGALSGIETAQRLRPLTHVPVIFLSAYSDEALLRQAGTVLPFGYLVKPFEERELHATIQMALYKHQMERALRESNVRLEEKVRERTAELARSRESLAVTLDSIGDAVLTTDAEGAITLMNPAAEDLTDWPHDDAIGLPLNQILHLINEETREPIALPMRIVLATGQRQFLPAGTSLVTRIGGERSVSGNTAPIREAGRIAGVIVVLREETGIGQGSAQPGNEQSTNLLHEHLHTFETLASQAPVGIVYMNADACCEYVNARYCELRGINHAEAIRTHWLTGVHPDDSPRVFEEWERARALNAPFECECRFLHPDGRIVQTLALATPVRNPEDTITGYIGTLTNLPTSRAPHDATLTTDTQSTPPDPARTLAPEE
jgi:PAS domain S-box-containing protein